MSDLDKPIPLPLSDQICPACNYTLTMFLNPQTFVLAYLFCSRCTISYSPEPYIAFTLKRLPILEKNDIPTP